MEAVGLRNGAAFVANPGSEPRRLPRHALPVATPSVDTQRRCGEHQRQQGVQQQPKRGAGPCSANASAAHGSSANGNRRPVGVDVLEQRQQQGAPAVAAPDGGGDGGELPLVWTKFVAETLLPTKQGKFRLRGYRHTVRFECRGGKASQQQARSACTPACQLSVSCTSWVRRARTPPATHPCCTCLYRRLTAGAPTQSPV